MPAYDLGYYGYSSRSICKSCHSFNFAYMIFTLGSIFFPIKFASLKVTNSHFFFFAFIW